MEEAVADALRHSQLLGIQRATAREALADVVGARAALLPTAALEARVTRLRGGIDLGEAVNPANRALNELLGEARFPTDLDLALPLRHETRLRIVQPLVNRSATAARRAARHLAEGEVAWTAGVARQVAAEAQRALLRASAAREGRRILASALERVTEAERVAGHLLAEGLVTPSVLLQARADRNEVEGQLEEARSHEDAARWELNRLTGRDAEAPVPDMRARLNVRLSPNLGGAWIESGPATASHERREELARADASLRAAEAAAEAARAARHPTVALVLDPGFQGSAVRFGSDSWTASVSVVGAWSLFAGGRIRAGIEAAEADLARAREVRSHVAEGVALQVRVAERALKAADAALPAAEARLAAALEVHALTLRRFQEGLASPFELTDAREALTAAELGCSLARHQRLLHWVELEFAAALRSLDP